MVDPVQEDSDPGHDGGFSTLTALDAPGHNTDSLVTPTTSQVDDAAAAVALQQEDTVIPPLPLSAMIVTLHVESAGFLGLETHIMLAVISPGWKDRQEDWDHISRLVSWDIFQMLLGARLGQVSIGIDIIGRIKHEREIVATLEIISCKVSDIEFPLPVLPQPATETEMFKYLDFKLLTFSNLIFIQFTGAGRQTDWPNFGVSSETD